MFILNGYIMKTVGIYFLLFFPLVFSGCAMMAIPSVTSVVVTATQSAVTDVVTTSVKDMADVYMETGNNEKQLKDNLEKVSQRVPLESTYSENYDKVWDNVIVSLEERKEMIRESDNYYGYVRSEKKGWVEEIKSSIEEYQENQKTTEKNMLIKMSKSLKNFITGKTICYSYNIQITQVEKGVSVKAEVVFTSKTKATAEKPVEMPEAGTLLRLRFFETLNQKIIPTYVKLPINPYEDIKFQISL